MAKANKKILNMVRDRQYYDLTPAIRLVCKTKGHDTLAQDKGRGRL